MEFFTGFGIVLAILLLMLLLPRLGTVVLAMIILGLTRLEYTISDSNTMYILIFVAIVAFALDCVTINRIAK
ncbi:MAG: hypothetical protein A2915_00855 [Candidatus Yanofskybacteria bacterium RIFCSPLOWO2_01_FULL_41_34]|uniref:Uncharacterized protein n=1 Tax=Candidatus Yanofskybacteria bacterium RIFCSPHIGHO2_01_FULL_41_26 TaxID=1802661 RepID=A0A1F8ECA3_9BACT|nr:MAG: hypothetical protein A2649_02890 [Candidatus Yanofskybacteria bacterium RIFCSPHIGHO2_01_FULL_41_26]OGN22443.1 MAG: hypothetical protein A2915_00855 [Candidatus Yanofskybacteria bacterium RIFCSPLOWO2_01_FULL_41_34]